MFIPNKVFELIMLCVKVENLERISRFKKLEISRKKYYENARSTNERKLCGMKGPSR